MFDLTQALAKDLLERGRTRLRHRLTGGKMPPWMRPQERRIVSEILQRLQPSRCLEWGSGMSTLTFPALISPEARWLSIEHDSRWAEIVRRANQRPNVATAHVPPDAPDWTRDGDANAFASYLSYPAAHGPYDFILLDGRARMSTLRIAPSLLADGGVVILHDANRSEYVEACGAFPHQILFQDARTSERRPPGGVLVASLTRPLHTVLNVALHQRIWHFYSGIGKPLA